MVQMANPIGFSRATDDDEAKRASDALAQGNMLGAPIEQPTGSAAGVQDPLNKQASNVLAANDNGSGSVQSQKVAELKADPTKIVRANEGENFVSGLDAAANEKTAGYKKDMQSNYDAWNKAAVLPKFDLEGVSSLDNTVAARLNTTYKAPSAFDYQIGGNSGLAALMSPDGQMEAIKDRSGVGYTQGMQALDSAILGRQKNDFSKALNDNQDLRAVYQGLIDKSKAVVDQGKQDWDVETGAIKDSLKGISSSLQGQQAQELAAAQVQQQAEVQARNAAYAAQMNAAKQAAVDSFNSKSGSVYDVTQDERDRAQAAFANGLDISSYLKQASQGNLSEEQFYDATEARKFNRVMELLGEGKRVSEGSIAGVQQGNLDQKAIQDYVNKQMSMYLDPLHKIGYDRAHASPSSIKSIAGGLGSAMIDTPSDMVNSAGSAIDQGIIQPIITAPGKAVDVVTTGGSKVAQTASSAVTGAIKQAGKDVDKTIAQPIVGAAKSVGKAAGKVGKKIKSLFS